MLKWRGSFKDCLLKSSPFHRFDYSPFPCVCQCTNVPRVTIRPIFLSLSPLSIWPIQILDLGPEMPWVRFTTQHTRPYPSAPGSLGHLATGLGPFSGRLQFPWRPKRPQFHPCKSLQRHCWMPQIGSSPSSQAVRLTRLFFVAHSNGRKKEPFIWNWTVLWSHKPRHKQCSCTSTHLIECRRCQNSKCSKKGDSKNTTSQ